MLSERSLLPLRERCAQPKLQVSVALRSPASMGQVFAHHGYALAQADQLGHFERVCGQVNCRLAETAIADARIVMYRFQRVPVLAALAIQATLLDVDAQSGDLALTVSGRRDSAHGSPGADSLHVITGPARIERLARVGAIERNLAAIEDELDRIAVVRQCSGTCGPLRG